MEQNTIKEERLYERLNLPIKLNYEVLTRPHDLKNAISKNISGGGICISLTERLLPGTKINIGISVPKPNLKQTARRIADNIESSKADHYSIKAKVVWSRPVEISGKEGLLDYFDTGIQFLEDKPVIIGKIVSYFYGRQF